MKNVAILGGGFAGLAAGVALSELGFQVSLFERRPILGGRAYSVKDSTTGDTIDNGQHLFMGCYHHTFRFLEKIGTLSLLQFQEQTRVGFADSLGKRYALQCPNLPFPLHLLGGLIRLQSLSWSERWAMIRMMRSVAGLTERDLQTLDSLTAYQWLILLGQSESSIRRFWEPLILATLNELPSLSSAQMLAVVLREALLKNKKDSRLVLSTVGLSELYTEAAKNFIELRGGRVLTKRGVSKIKISPSPHPLPLQPVKTGEGEWKIEKIILEDGSEQVFDFYVSALTPDVLLSVMDSSEVTEHPFFHRFKNFNFSPILSVNLWFDRPVLDETFVGLLESPVHWVFNKGAILKSGKEGRYLSLVISAAYDLKDLGQEELLKIVLKALHESLPKSREAILKHSRILKELRATPSFSTNSLSLRPSCETPLSNFFLAGDWTATGLLATIEGAVKSGHVAAEKVEKRLRIL